MDYSQFIKIFGPRLKESVNWKRTMRESYELYNENGEDQFITELENTEGFDYFCGEYYDFMREHWNACSASMWDSYNEFKTEFKNDTDKYWEFLNRMARKPRR